MGSLEGWFRHKYQLAPTDERLLRATAEEIRVDYWFHELARRLQVARENDLPVDTLDDVLAGVTVEERMEALKRQSAADAPPEPLPTPDPHPHEEEVIIHYEAPHD